MAYDDSNVFARILRGEIPAKTVYEDEFALAFHDINPQAPIHVLVIPKGPYVSMADFSRDAPAELIVGYHRAIAETINSLNVDAPGFRLIANHGSHGHQEVPHLHVHILGGRPLGPMLDRTFAAQLMSGMDEEDDV